MLGKIRCFTGCCVPAFALVLVANPVRASYGIYVGKNLTADGSVFLAGYGDEPSSHWLEVVARRQHLAGATITVGATEKARYPGKLLPIPASAWCWRPQPGPWLQGVEVSEAHLGPGGDDGSGNS